MTLRDRFVNEQRYHNKSSVTQRNARIVRTRNDSDFHGHRRLPVDGVLVV